MTYELTQHARDVLAERHIPVEWLERALREPELKQPDPADATLERRYRKIPEHQNRCYGWSSIPRLPRNGW